MTAAVYRSTPDLSVPPTQNTAPVFEFNCLYTHDVKKKAKKWQDGFLRYHAFNKRVMVYDVPRNLIGDCHWTEDDALQEGDELRLERNGVMVEVGDSIGQTETDLSELRKSRKKDTAVNMTKPAVVRPTVRPVNGTAPARGNAPQKHRSLGALLGTPKGPIGKAALPQRSPFEDRHAQGGTENEEWEDGRPPKRQRMVTAPEWSVTRNTNTAKPMKQLETPLWARKVDAAKKQKKAASEAGQQKLATKEVITLSDDDNNAADSRDPFLPCFSDDALVPSSPVKDKRKDACKAVGRSSSPAFQTQHAPAPARPSKETVRPKSRANERKRAQSPIRPHSPLKETSRTMAPPRVREESGRDTSERLRLDPKPDARSDPQPSKPASGKSGHTLRLAASAPKKSMLLCQAQVSKKPMRISSTSSERQANTSFDAGREHSQNRPMTAKEKLEARLARIDQKEGSTSSARFQSKGKPAPIEIESDDGTADGNESDEGEGNGGRSQSTHERSAIELRRLDEMMLPPAAPIVPSRTPKPPSTARPTKPPSPPPPEPRTLRRVASESVTAQSSRPKRMPGAPVRYTPSPSPTKGSRQTTPVPAAASKQTNNVPATNKPDVPSKTYKQKKPLQKSVSLNVTSNGTSTVMLSRPFQAPGKAAKTREKEPEPPKDVGPWSREAFDLFLWRPPNWDEEKWCVTSSEGVPSAPDGLSGGASLPHVL
ncbi:hypothetical protein M409DRAFT_26339 [Zasmidium cellare ATCC 36951]|uniref:5'-3' DNA helicase ZGRF1-like N-terminal domain-containing protein n=1 Tax=Zasmidium cellare ATCC 36951 TaxID=1080233 RepID=A0A6A6CAQ1_ZASCE|nr:uncharacterized protein M409DRAFT_26339 [Zasmidium cellare ATCC 36951]KAF2163300.1 hypothetical protein M409DRAFT_26339 [Zasmidium cellare ATCC 36951]